MAEVPSFQVSTIPRERKGSRSGAKEERMVSGKGAKGESKLSGKGAEGVLLTPPLCTVGCCC